MLLMHVLLGILLLSPVAQAATVAQTVKWELDVIEEGQIVDRFSDVTRIGQAQIVSASHPAAHDPACPAQGRSPAPTDSRSWQLTRTLTVSPTHIGKHRLGFIVDTHEILEDTGLPIPSDCNTAPERRSVRSTHPDWMVRTDGQWNYWQLLKQNPSLIYRLKAKLSGSGASS
jgi:hypothetical protein